MFEYQFVELPKHGYRCIGIDLQGFGDSDKPWDGYNYNTMADDIKAVLDAVDLQDATLVGFSIGGAISIRYMSREDFPYGLDKSALDGLIVRLMKTVPL